MTQLLLSMTNHYFWLIRLNEIIIKDVEKVRFFTVLKVNYNLKFQKDV